MITLTAWLGLACTAGPDDAALEVPDYIETGDLDAVSERGYLRILVPPSATPTPLPRRGFPLDHEVELAEDLAESLDLVPVVIPVEGHDRIIPALLEGRGDIAAAALARTPEREARVTFTAPLTRVREQLVQRADEPPIRDPSALDGRRLVLRPSSSYWQTGLALEESIPGLELVAADESIDTPSLIRGVAEGRYDLTVADDDIVRATLHTQADVASHLALSEPRPVGWAVRPDADGLAAHIDGFLATYDLAGMPASRFAGDLEVIHDRGVIRLLTRNSAATYFLHRGELMGFEYELWQAFADELGLRLQVVVPPSRDQLLPWLHGGKGDFVAAGLTITDKRLADPEMAWSDGYHEAAEVVVGRRGERVRRIADLRGRKVAVRPSSSYHETLTELIDDGLRVELVDVPEDRETESILRGVADGTYDLAVADSHLVSIEQAHRLPIEAAFEIQGPRPHGIAVRAEDEALLDALNAFIEDVRERPLYAILHRRYFEDERGMGRSMVRSDVDGELSPFDDLVRDVADEHDIDWRLVVAQIYQESHFDPDARSWAGARGLLQLMPRTAAELGVTDPSDPAQSIEGGVTYLGDLRDRFGDDLLRADRNWLALASYNAGYGHVLDAQSLARQRGLDPGRWFGNVERAMRLLMKPRFARQARYGYVRATEPIHYVQRIRDRYQAYRAVE